MPSNKPIMDEGEMINAWQSVRAIVLAAVESMARLAIGFAPTKRIETAIEHGVKMVESDKIAAYIGVDVQKAPEAAAYEFGSGLYANRGPRRKYDINPKAGNPSQRLVFGWPNEPAYVKDHYAHTKDGKVVLLHVSHPGVVAKPFLEPAFNSAEQEKVVESIYMALQSAVGVEPGEIRITSEVLIL